MAIGRGLDALLRRRPITIDTHPRDASEFEFACKAGRISAVAIDQSSEGFSLSFRLIDAPQDFRIANQDGKPRTWQNLNSLAQYLHKNAPPLRGITLNLLSPDKKASR